MKRQDSAVKAEIASQQPTALKWSSLQARMTVSYALTTLAAVLLIEILFVATIYTLLTYGSLADGSFVNNARQSAKLYALAAQALAGDRALDPRMTFAPGKPFSIALAKVYFPDHGMAPYTTTVHSGIQNTSFALLIAPDGRVLVSSFPSRYPTTGLATQMLPSRASLIKKALAGQPDSAIEGGTLNHVIGVTEPVWSCARQPLGAIYLQIPTLSNESAGLFQGFTLVVIVSGIFWLLVTLPVGGLFGMLTTRGLVRRLRRLASATTRFAAGEYTHRVQVSRRDEVGILEEQFNHMAAQLVESTTQQQVLAGQNARLAERTRIARDLHDSVKQQSFAVSMQLGAALALLEIKPEAARQHLEEAETLAYHVQQELTTLIQELRPVGLQDKGLAVALKDYVIMWSRQRAIEADLHIVDAQPLPLPVEEALWRVAQEALSNVARHSEATRVEIDLVYKQDEVILALEDNGHGFDTSTVGEAGVGLHSMRERMEALGGTVTLQSKVGEGTRIRACCSCTQAKNGMIP